MSLPDRVNPSFGMCCRAGALALLVAVAGCTVRPMYGDVTSATTVGGAPAASLASIEIPPVNDRVGQEVRNHLIFLLNGGAGQPANPAYRLTLSTYSFHASAASVQPSTQALEPTAEVFTVRVTYTLSDIATGKTIASGVRTSQAPYDVSRQAFAAVRARRDAANRGAREVAEFLRLAVAQELERPSAVTPPRVVSAAGELEGFSETDTDGRLPR